MGMVLQERNRIASECHDTLMAGFAAISWQLEATARLFRDAGVHAEPASQSCDLARSMVAHCQAEARRIIWDLRDSDEITNSLSRALAEVTSTYRSRETPQTTLDIQGDEIPISPGAVHHLACIGQEAVTNAFHHAKPSSIHVQLAFESTSLRLSCARRWTRLSCLGPFAAGRPLRHRGHGRAGAQARRIAASHQLRDPRNGAGGHGRLSQYPSAGEAAALHRSVDRGLAMPTATECGSPRL